MTFPLTQFIFQFNIPQNCLYNKKFWEELFAYFPWYDTGHIENDASNNSSIVSAYLLPRWRLYRAVS
jgi:hypothetical protein